MSGYSCPVEGCDYGDGQDEQKSLPAVRAHVNATGDDAHNWSDCREQLADQDASHSSQSEESDPPEEPEEPEKSAGETEDTEDSEDSEEDMPTQAEYEMQHEGEEESEDTSNGANAAAGAAAGAAGIGALLDRPMFLGALVVLAVVVLLAWDGSGEPTPTNQEAAGEQPHPADAGSPDEQGGGLS